MKQKTEIEVELNETVAYARRGERFEAYCPQCRSLVEMAKPHMAAILAKSTERKVYRLIETGTVHFVESGGVSICLRSLTNTKQGELL